MNLLISNDDGIFALGIQTLANTLAAAGHTVTVVCPDRERSATGHGLTLHDPLRVEPVEGLFADSIQAWACSGTPSDCIKLGLGALLEQPPDYVLSGINHGANLGTDVFYSGTVSAAMEGFMAGIPSIAVSLVSFSYQDFQPAAQATQWLLTQLPAVMSAAMLFNVNVPAVPLPEMSGVAVTRQGIRRYFDVFQKRIDPRGKTYYWLAGELVEEGDFPASDLRSQAGPHWDPLELGDLPRSDVQAIRENYITITPLQTNLTCLSGLMGLKEWELECQNGLA